MASPPLEHRAGLHIACTNLRHKAPYHRLVAREEGLSGVWDHLTGLDLDGQEGGLRLAERVDNRVERGVGMGHHIIKMALQN